MSQSNVPLFEMNNKFKMPSIGLGTSSILDKEKMKQLLKEALDLGYRLFDTAISYNN